MSEVHLIATGGTIASRRSPRGLLAGASGAELVEAAGLSQSGIVVTDVEARGSYAVTLPDLLDLARLVRDTVRAGATGVVVTHGTDTMEETAFLLDLLHDSPVPIVLTGAQRPLDSVAPDGPANLADAVQVARSGQAVGLGALVVFDGLAFQARGVRKTETLRSGAFSAPGRGAALRVTGSGVLTLARHPRAEALDLDAVTDLPRVDVVATYAGADDALLEAAVTVGARGLVLQALGAGNVPPPVTHAVARVVARGVPVLVTSRVPTGPVAPLYAGGGGADLARAGAVFAGDLSPWQARLLLAVAAATRPEDPTTAVTTWLGSTEPGTGGA